MINEQQQCEMNERAPFYCTGDYLLTGGFVGYSLGAGRECRMPQKEEDSDHSYRHGAALAISGCDIEGDMHPGCEGNENGAPLSILLSSGKTLAPTPS